jgi:hypothetical protein
MRAPASAGFIIVGLPACQTILNAIGNLLADDCQVEEFLFAEDIFDFSGKLTIHRRLVPKVIIPIHACHCARPLLMAQGASIVPPTAQGSTSRGYPDLVSLPDVPRKLPRSCRFRDGYGACSEAPPPRR